LITALGAGPVDIFGSSGGAVNGLALVARHQEQVRTLVAHEQPDAQVLLPDQFGLPTEDDGNRDDPMAGQHIVNTTHYEQDFDALRAASTRIVIGAGSESEGRDDLPRSGGLGERLGTEAVTFPSHHAGFIGGEFGACRAPLTRSPATLRQVLTEDG
jgi:pimeloyl-ACP methyl ester carboxylesterase